MYMSIRSARINVLVTPEEKMMAEALAAKHEMSLSDLVRLSIADADADILDDELTEDQMDELKILVPQFDQVIDEINARLDSMHERHELWKTEINALRRKHGHAEV